MRTCGTYSTHRWDQCNPALIDGVLKGLLKGLQDPHLAVQGAAACSMSAIIAAPGAQGVIKPILPDVVGQYFRIMDELESDSVLSALQVCYLRTWSFLYHHYFTCYRCIDGLQSCITIPHYVT